MKNCVLYASATEVQTNNRLLKGLTIIIMDYNKKICPLDSHVGILAKKENE